MVIDNNMKKHHNLSRSGFTLVEMLIVVAVLGMLLGLLASAILQSVKTAQKRARSNERALLEEAIVQFWHDQKTWPIKKGDKPKKKYNKETKKDEVDYKLVYREDNYEVFGQLVNADFGGQKEIKTYIDLGRHITTPIKVTSYPAFDAISLRDALESGNRDPVLVYWADLKKCPHCPASSGGAAYSDLNDKTCVNDACTYFKKEGVRYQFEPADRKNSIRGVLPFTVTIDLLNNAVRVDE